MSDTAKNAKTETQPETTAYKLVSRLKNPVRLKLKDGQTVFIAAHGTIETLDSALVDIEKLPVGIHYVPFQA